MKTDVFNIFQQDRNYKNHLSSFMENEKTFISIQNKLISLIFV